MISLNKLWILLSDDAVLWCNESKRNIDREIHFMSHELFTKIAKKAANNSWKCSVLVNKGGLPEEYGAICNNIQADIISPADGNSVCFGAKSTIVFESNQLRYATHHNSNSKIIFRIKRNDVKNLSQLVFKLLNRFSDISIRHPELLNYDEGDMQEYKYQLQNIGNWMLEHNGLSMYRINCLTDRIKLSEKCECGAGNTGLAVDPTGFLYLCPATIDKGSVSYGHLLKSAEIPNQQLLTREYSLPCQKCDAMHCLRCIKLNKYATGEFCVPAKNVCILAHVELEAQAQLAKRAIENGMWNKSWNQLLPPTIYDPYELVKDAYAEDAVNRDNEDTNAEASSIGSSRSRLACFTGRPRDLSPVMMLDIIHDLGGRLEALTECVKCGHVPSAMLVEQDPLIEVRNKTIKRYRHTVFQEKCPTIHQIESLLYKVAQDALTRKGVTF